MPTGAARTDVPTAVITLVRDGSIDGGGADSKDRKAMSAIMKPTNGTFCLAVFSDESLGIVGKLHQDATSKQCDVGIVMLDSDETTRTLVLNNMGTSMLGFIGGLLGGSFTRNDSTFFVNSNYKIADDGVVSVLVREGDNESKEQSLLELLKEGETFACIFAPPPLGPTTDLSDCAQLRKVFTFATIIDTMSVLSCSYSTASASLSAFGDKAPVSVVPPLNFQSGRLMRVEAALCSPAGKHKVSEFEAAINNGYLQAPDPSDSVAVKIAFIAENLHFSLPSPAPPKAPPPMKGKRARQDEDEESESDDEDSGEESDKEEASGKSRSTRHPKCASPLAPPPRLSSPARALRT